LYVVRLFSFLKQNFGYLKKLVGMRTVDLSPLAVSRDKIIKEGWLFKQSRYLKDWRRRWIIITPSFICSFRSPDAIHQQPTEALRLADCNTVCG
jgi:hypothetical protein